MADAGPDRELRVEFLRGNEHHAWAAALASS
jgi:hypothetical protein